MEACTLKKKKAGVNKGKLKKTLKNILCRPDPIFWPLLSENHAKEVENSIKKLKVDIPCFKKPHWREVKSIPKEERPKKPKPEKVSGFFFGISCCTQAIQDKECATIIIDGDVNPRILVQHIVDACVVSKIPLLCLNGLKKITRDNFGFPSCCIGIKLKNDSIGEMRKQFVNISQSYKMPEKQSEDPTGIEMECDEKLSEEVLPEEQEKSFTYLYRTSKISRVFVPPSEKQANKKPLSFVGQDFIEFPTKQIQNPFMKMIVKKVTNNPNRIKKLKK